MTRSETAGTLWVAVMAAVFGIAALSSLEGVFWNLDLLFLLNLGVLAWTAPRTSEWTRILNLGALTIFCGRTTAEGVNYSVQNWLGLHDSWLPTALAVANYLAHASIAILTYHALPRERRHPILRLLITPVFALLLAIGWLVLAEDWPYTDMVERKFVSPTLVYEKWVVDIGGTSGEDCRVYRIRALGVVAYYRQIDPDRESSPISRGCGL